MAEYKVGDRIKISRKPDCWASLLSPNRPRNLSYPREFTIKEIKEDYSYTAMRAREYHTGCDYGFSLSDLISENNIIKVGEVGEAFTPTSEPRKSIMSAIIEYAKNLKLTADEKLLRKYGMQDSCGEFSDDYKRIVKAKWYAEKANVDYVLEILKAKEAEEVK